MAYIFLDESGDLGFDFRKKKTSRFFIVVFLFVKNKGPVEKIIKKIFKSFTKKEKRFHQGILHCFKEMPKTRIKILNLLKEKDVSVIAIYLNKKKVYTRLKDEKHVLYNYVTNILLDRVYNKKLIPINEPINLIASRRETNKFLNENFKNYLKNQINKNHSLRIVVEIKSPNEEKSLQVADFVSWAIYRKFEFNDESYRNLIKEKIVEESPLFP